MSVMPTMLLIADIAHPGYLAAGALLAAIPLVIHFLNRRRYRIVPWAAMDFLLRAMKQNRRRLRFESWLLLASRCLLLGLLGLALARPMGCNGNSLASLAAGRSGLHLLVIDNSCSMSYEAQRPSAQTQLDQAKSLADEIISRLSPGGETVAIITTAKPARLLTHAPLYDLQSARSIVDHIAQSYAPADLPGACDLAVKLARDDAGEPNKYLDFLDDSTRSKWTGAAVDGLASAGKSIASLYQVGHFDVSIPNESNRCIVSVQNAAALARLGFPNDFLATAHGFGATSAAALQWSVDNQFASPTASIELQPETAAITRSDLPLLVGGPHVIAVGLSTPDRMPIDDVAWRVVDVASELKALIVEGDRGNGPLDGSGAFLQLALSPPGDSAGSATRSSSYINAELISDLELPARVLRDESVVVLANVAQVSAEEADQLSAYVKQGGALLVFMGELINADAYNQSLLPRGLLPGPLVKRIGDAAGQKSYQLDFKPNGNLDPMLRAFQGEENSGLNTAQIYSYWQLDLPTDTQARRVLNYLTDHSRADPAITVHDLGKGRVVFVSTSANAQWTTLPAKPSYLTLMHELVAGAIRGGDGWMNLSAGDSLTLPASLQLTTAPTLSDPQQRPVELSPPSGEQATYRSVPLQQPGIYRLNIGARSIPIAVNVPAGSADVRPASGAEMQHALGDIHCTMLGDSLPPLDSMETAGNDYGWSVMLVLLVMVALECVLAMRLGRSRR